MNDIYFFDSSSLLKRYLFEPKGSAWVQAITDPSAMNSLYISDLTRVEIPSAITKKYRRGDITRSIAHGAIRLFNAHSRAVYGIIRPTPEVIDDAVQLVDRYPLTAYDAVQLASARKPNSLLMFNEEMRLKGITRQHICCRRRFERCLELMCINVAARLSRIGSGSISLISPP